MCNVGRCPHRRIAPPTADRFRARVDPVASIAASLKFAVVAALIATAIGFVAATAMCSHPIGRLLDATDAAARYVASPSARDAHHLRHATIRLAGAMGIVPLGHALVRAVRRSRPARGFEPFRRICARWGSNVGATPIQAWWQVDARALPARSWPALVSRQQSRRRVRRHHHLSRSGSERCRSLSVAYSEERELASRPGIRDGNDPARAVDAIVMISELTSDRIA